MGFVYLLLNLKNNKMYVGKTKSRPERRWQRHVRSAVNGSKCLIHRAIRKHGWRNFSTDILWSGPVADMASMEAMCVAWAGSMAPAGYNLTAGGDGSLGFKHTAATRKKLKAAFARRWAKPEEREKLAVANRGKMLSPEHRAAISASWNRPPLSKAARARISKARKGKPLSAEHCKKLSEARQAYLRRVAGVQ
jgi:group I intron endonuclease